jgi:hypothetical protein
MIDDEFERRLADHLTATEKRLPQHVREAVLDEVSRRSQVGAGSRLLDWIGRGSLVAGVAAAIVLAMVVAPRILNPVAIGPGGGQSVAPPGRSPLPDAPPGFGGVWTTTNCATWSGSGPVGQPAVIDCARWGDGTALTLQIDRGAPTPIRVLGASVPACSGTGELDPDPPPSPGGTFLIVTFHEVACGDIGLGIDRAVALYLEPAGDRIWLDDDGDEWGLFWVRQP